MCDAIEMLDYLNEYPPTHVIMKAVHMKDGRKHKGGRQTKAEAKADQMALAQHFGGASKMPQHLKDMVEWARSQSGKLTN